MHLRIYSNVAILSRPHGLDLVRTPMISSNNDSSQGIAKGLMLENPYSSSASFRRSRKIGWFRCFARTTYLHLLTPTETATCPGGISATRSILL
ncbi:hypothetical protein F2Q69_00009550 [Brassica cretica]|uniref:Uncharacterized protein n=1 Tax=Brassica cretica TaxID=69181 RepID=A0A8S9PFC0_BRACR|nr:hypothetical protein F2Q69_00009550 [Brassica cretica]